MEQRGIPAEFAIVAGIKLGLLLYCNRIVLQAQSIKPTASMETS